MLPMQQQQPQQQQGFPMVPVMQPNMQGMMGMNFGAQMPPGTIPIQVAVCDTDYWFNWTARVDDHWNSQICFYCFSFFYIRVGWRLACKLQGCSSWVSRSSWACGPLDPSTQLTCRNKWLRSISEFVAFQFPDVFSVMCSFSLEYNIRKNVFY